MKKIPFSVFFLFVAFIMQHCADRTHQEGGLIYKLQCATCHMDDGSGLAGLIPPLAGSDFLKMNAKNLPCLIRNGQRGPMTVNGKNYATQEMPAMPLLSDVEITNVLNFLSNHLGNENEVVTLEEVRKKLADCD